MPPAHSNLRVFLFKGWEISVDDFIFDFDGRNVTFVGSSLDNWEIRKLKSNISFSSFGERMKMISELIGEDGIEKVRERVWIGHSSMM